MCKNVKYFVCYTIIEHGSIQYRSQIRRMPKCCRIVHGVTLSSGLPASIKWPNFVKYRPEIVNHFFPYNPFNSFPFTTLHYSFYLQLKHKQGLVVINELIQN